MYKEKVSEKNAGRVVVICYCCDCEKDKLHLQKQSLYKKTAMFKKKVAVLKSFDSN